VICSEIDGMPLALYNNWTNYFCFHLLLIALASTCVSSSPTAVTPTNARGTHNTPAILSQSERPSQRIPRTGRYRERDKRERTEIRRAKCHSIWDVDVTEIISWLVNGCGKTCTCASLAILLGRRSERAGDPMRFQLSKSRC
jgi:hypothetical protein